MTNTTFDFTKASQCAVKYNKDAVKDAADCQELMRFFGATEHSQGRFSCLWREGSDSGSVAVEKDKWYDHKEKEGGDAINLIEKAKGLKFPEAVNWLGDHLHLQPVTSQKKKIVAEYIYTDADGKPLHMKIRYQPKSFSQAHFTPEGWKPGLKGVQTVLYHLPEVIAAVREGKQIFQTEGEKDCDNLAKLGFIATTQTMGAGKWQPSYTDVLKGANVCVIADKDDAGRKHAELVASKLNGTAQSVQVIELPGEQVKDATDWIEAGGTAEELKAIVQDAESWQPGQKIESDNDRELMQALTERCGTPYFLNKYLKITQLNERFFGAFYHAKIAPVYDPDNGNFFKYDAETGLWQRQESATVLSEVHRVIKDATGSSEDVLRLCGSAQIKRIIDFAKADCSCPDFFETATRKFIHCSNGVLEYSQDFRKWELQPFASSYRSRNRTELAYKPDSSCCRFLNELVCPAMDREDVEVLQLYFGQCLIGYNSSQKFLLITGTPGAGKSTLANIIEQVVNRKNCTELRLEHMDERFEINRLIGKTLLTAKDVPSGFMQSKGAFKLKALVGNDTLTAEAKGQNNAKDVAGNFNVIVTSNSNLKISLDGDAGAWRRRLLWIKYELPPPANPITDFDKILLKEEGEGILQWGLEGAARLLIAGGKIERTASQERRIESLLNESDSVCAFVSDCVIPAPNASVTTAELLSAYINYCRNQAWEPVTPRQFENSVMEAMLNKFTITRRNDIKREGKNQRGYVHVRVTNGMSLQQ